MRKRLTAVVCLFLPGFVMAQDGLSFQQEYRLHVKRSWDTIRLDGNLDENTWKHAAVSSDFWMKWPNDQGRPKRKTEVRLSYDAQNLYIGVVAYDTSFHVVQTLKRDNGIYESDAFSIAIDPVNQRTNGFLFSITPYNVQTEDLVNSNSGDQLSFSWDNKWYSATVRHANRWTAEIAIPFKTLRYNAGKSNWGINFLRSDLKNNEYSTWTRVPVNFPFYDFGYSGSLVWDQPPPPPGTNISFIPYVTGSMNSNPEEDEPTTGKFNAGFDGKIAVTPSMNLDITVNPDFSQVEVDRQVTNLTRFDIFFPERRTFFLENDDLFSNYAIPPIRPFYSRRIGLDEDGNSIPIIGGLRLSGNLSGKTRIGLMNMQTLKKGDFAAQNYTAVTFNQRVQSRSLIKGYFLNRQAFSEAGKFDNPLDEYGRNAGLEYNFSDKAGKWNAWSGFHRSFKPTIDNQDIYVDLGMMYATKTFEAVVDYSDVANSFYTDMGFINRIESYDALLDSSFRNGFRQLFNSFSYRFYPKEGPFNQHRIQLENFTVFNRDGSLNETLHTLGYQMLLRNTSSFSFNLAYSKNNLPYYTRFTDDTYQPLPPDEYSYMQADLRYGSDTRKKFVYGGSVRYGGFYNGTLFQTALSVTWRVQPWGNFSLQFENSQLEFPDDYGSTNLVLVAPRIEINFSNNLFWTTFIQFNNQNNNFNINSRLQWRYKPMSDIFLVYTDNYFTDPLFKNKNRAIIFKMNYWLNL
jgi:hypothetical protein